MAKKKKQKAGKDIIGKLDNVLSKLEKSNPNKILIIEDGGYAVPLIHKKYKNIILRTVGAIEQTIRGIRNDNEIQTHKFPIMSVATAKIKNDIEPAFVADTVIRNIENLVPFPLSGKKVALLGYGTIGQKIADRLKDKGANLTVYDPDKHSTSMARNQGFNIIYEPYNVVKDKSLIIGCSGETSISRNEILEMDNDTYLVSASSDQKEIGLEELDFVSGNKQKSLINPGTGEYIGTSYYVTGTKNNVHLIANGYPVNFWKSDSMPNQVSDLILSLILVCAIELCENSYQNGICNVDNIGDKFELSKLYDEYSSK